MQWFRWYHGTCADPKLGSIARKCGATRERVIATWAMILESASENQERGAFTVDADAIADCLNCPTADIQTIIDEMATRGMIGAGRVTKWNERQPARDDSAIRQRRKRERDTNKPEGKNEGDADVTRNARDSDAPVTPPDTETDTEQPPVAPQGAASAALSPSRDEIGEEFEDLWRAYGGNSARGKATNPKAPALDRYRRIRKSGVPAERILAGAKGYVAAMEDCGKHGTEYTKQLVAWLNQRLWEQYADPNGDDSDSPATRAMEAALARGEREVATRIFRLRQAGQHREADDEGRRYLGEAA